MANHSVIPTARGARDQFRQALITTIGALLLGSGAIASADVYKWIDERGVVNYSDEAPQGRAAQKMDRTMNRLIVVPPSPDSTERSRRLADDLMRARLEREHREHIARYTEQAGRSEAREEALLKSWRQRCLAEQWADCDHAPTLYNRYAEFPYYVPLVQSRLPLAPTGLLRPLPPRVETPRVAVPVDRATTPAAPVKPAPVKPAPRRIDR